MGWGGGGGAGSRADDGAELRGKRNNQPRGGRGDKGGRGGWPDDEKDEWITEKGREGMNGSFLFLNATVEALMLRLMHCTTTALRKCTICTKRQLDGVRFGSHCRTKVSRSTSESTN